MTTPADHAATVREALAWYSAGLNGPAQRLEDSLAALDALQAQAEDAEKLENEAYDLGHSDGTKSAEAERDRLKAHVARHREQMDDYERLEAERDRWKGMCEYERRERDRLRDQLTEWETSIATERLTARVEELEALIARAALNKEKA